MKTRITELFDIPYPILLSGMSWISTPELVAAVCNAGGLGILATGILSADQTLEYVQRTRELTDKPFAANVTLYFPGAERNARVLIEEKVPIINYALGKGDKITEAVHAYGGKVMATVTNARHALAAQRDGADALIATGHEAAGHGGEVTSLVLVPSLVRQVKIPVIAAGGFADGRGLLAALSLGADGISMGTRFMSTVESPVNEVQKQACRASKVEDTLYTNRVDGLYARVMKTEGALRVMRKRLNPISVLFLSRKIAKLLGFPWMKLAMGILLSGYRKSIQMARMAIGFEAFQSATIDGDNARGVLPLGQVTGLIEDTPTVQEVIDRIMAEASEILAALPDRFQ
ncbi:MAG: nitronate monooxygenase [Bradymonadales bacterium]|nr:nitronate monooxygenase [Bradymonadales bacterium]